MPEITLPDIEQKVVVIGRTGSGKTVGATWILSRAPFNVQPYIIVNHKSDELLNSISYVPRIGYNEIPAQPGVYMIEPTPDDDDELVEGWLRRIWQKQNVGLFLDEGFEISRYSRAFSSILKQGRSRHIPLIICNQRPLEMHRSVFTETDKLMIFRLADQRDSKVLAEFVPPDSIPASIPQYCSVWIDRNSEQVLRLNPVPGAEAILDTFEDRLRPRHKHTWV